MLKNFGLLDTYGPGKNPAPSNYDTQKFFSSLQQENEKVEKRKERLREQIRTKEALINSGLKTLNHYDGGGIDLANNGNSPKERQYNFVEANKKVERKPKVKKKLEDIIKPVELHRYTDHGDSDFEFDFIRVQKKAVYSFQNEYGSKIEKKENEVKNKNVQLDSDKKKVRGKPMIPLPLKPLPKIAPSPTLTNSPPPEDILLKPAIPSESPKISKNKSVLSINKNDELSESANSKSIMANVSAVALKNQRKKEIEKLITRAALGKLKSKPKKSRPSESNISKSMLSSKKSSTNLHNLPPLPSNRRKGKHLSSVGLGKF